MVKTTITFFVLLLAINLYPQEKSKESSKDEVGVEFKGFVKTDIMFDTRQTVSVREGHLLLYPQPELQSIDSKDLNAKANFNILSIQTRLTTLISGPEVLDAKTSGVVEGAFFGHSNGDINGFRLRHAYLKLDWGNSVLLIGQYWHPMFIPEVFPGVVSFNTGVPFQPFSRNPQIRFMQKLTNLELTFTAASQRDFSSIGPDGTSSVYLRNSVIPILDFNLKYKSDNLVAGAGINYKTLTPKLESDLGYKTAENIGSISAMVFAKAAVYDFSIKVEGVYGGNLTDLLMLGGYAVHSTEPTSGIEEYTEIKTLSVWTDLSFGSKLKFGLFAGYTKNLGADDIVTGTAYTRGENIDNVFRVSPRIIYRINNIQFAGEVEYTSAAYGTVDNELKVNDAEAVANTRLLFAAYLFF